MTTTLKPMAEMTTDELAALKSETDGMIGRLNLILLRVVPGDADPKRDCIIAVEGYLQAIEEEMGRRRERESGLIAPELGWPID